MTDIRIVPLAGMRLPADGPLLRDYTRPEGDRPQSYRAEYDRSTLFYDAVQTRTNTVVLTAPPFLNLWEPFRAGLMRNEIRPSLRRRRYKRSEQVEIRGGSGNLSIDIANAPHTLTPRPSEADWFAGLNCLLALNRDNWLDAIADWARYHVERHGAEGLVVIDNGSVDYSLDQLADALRGNTGLKRVLIYDAPFPYGALGRGKGRQHPKFFQTAMLNLARIDAVAKARAVLSVDIDELVEGPEGESVFDATVGHPLGMVTVRGYWGYPPPGDAVPCGHEKHRYRGVPDKKCNRKWCMTPRGFIGRAFPWDTHQIGGFLQNMFTEQTRFRHLHCRGTSTGWKKKRFEFDTEIARDSALDVLMDRYFSERPVSQAK